MTNTETNVSIEKTPLVSIIVPVYRVEEYLRRCIESIINQTYSNFELILVDDGSPDNCGKICDEYAQRYDFITVIHQINQGISAARNNAVKKAQGDYITFVDSDDFVTADYLEYLVSVLRKYNADVSVGGSIYQYEDSEIKIPKNETYTTFHTPEEALITMNYVKDYGTVAWGKLYKKELVELYPYPIGKRYEDIATTYKIIGASRGVAFGNKQIYYWIQRSNSFMHSKFSESQLDGLEAVKSQLSYIQKQYPAAIPAAKYRYTAKAVELAQLLLFTDGNREIFKRLKGHMNEYAKEVLKDENAKRSMKIRIKAMQMGYFPAKIVFRLHDRVKRTRL